jgi:hypothetical protein
MRRPSCRTHIKKFTYTHFTIQPTPSNSPRNETLTMHPTTPLLPLLLLVAQTTATLAPASSNTKAKYPSSPACSGKTFPVSPHVRTHLTPPQSPKPRAPSKPPSAATTHASPRKPLPSSQPTTSTTRSPVPRTARARPTRVRPGARWSRPRISGRFSGMALA